MPKRIDHPSATPRKIRSVADTMRPFALHWRCHGLAPGVEATPEATAAGRAYERLWRGLSGPERPGTEAAGGAGEPLLRCAAHGVRKSGL